MKNYIWRVTHSGWFLACPVYLAEVSSPDIVPIPRYRLWLLFDFMMIIQQGINLLLSLSGNPDACGFLFHSVKEIKAFDYFLRSK